MCYYVSDLSIIR